jgi:hypothetical protein
MLGSLTWIMADSPGGVHIAENHIQEDPPCAPFFAP